MGAIFMSSNCRGGFGVSDLVSDLHCPVRVRRGTRKSPAHAKTSMPRSDTTPSQSFRKCCLVDEPIGIP